MIRHDQGRDWLYMQSDWNHDNWKRFNSYIGNDFLNRAKIYKVTIPPPFKKEIIIKEIICISECVFHAVMIDWAQGKFNQFS